MVGRFTGTAAGHAPDRVDCPERKHGRYQNSIYDPVAGKGQRDVQKFRYGGGPIDCGRFIQILIDAIHCCQDKNGHERNFNPRIGQYDTQ